MPENQQATIRDIAQTAMEHVKAIVGKQAGVTDVWLSGYQSQ